LVVHGQAGKTEVTLPASLPAAGEDAAVGRLWGRARLEDILDRAAERGLAPHEAREEALGLALKFGLVSPYTAFVAVDRESTALGGKVTTLQVAQPLPAGLDLAGFAAPGALPPAPMPGQVRAMPAMVAPPRQRLQRSVTGPLPAASASPKASAPQDSLPRSAPVRSLLGKLFSKSSSGAGAPDQSSPILPDGENTDAFVPRAEPLPEDGEAILRWLARTQKMDGSWDNDLEKTAVAVLVFVRSGNTPRSGSYRRQVGRAIAWLVKASPPVSGAAVRATVLAELARRLNQPDLAQAADQAVQQLPPPATESEKLLQASLQAPEKQASTLPPVRTLEDLRLAALLGLNAPVPPDLLSGPQGDLARLWKAAITIRP
jgi:Ca-activated chloride channel homolog